MIKKVYCLGMDEGTRGVVQYRNQFGQTIMVFSLPSDYIDYEYVSVGYFARESELPVSPTKENIKDLKKK